nr:cytosolic carboxypeptidase 2 [Hymenolepis microstoma]
MAAHEMAFPGHLALPDIEAYRQFSNHSRFPLHSPSRIRNVSNVKLGGIDGRLNPESFFLKSRSAGKLKLAASSLADGVFEFPTLDISHNEQAVESYMRKNGVKNQFVIKKNHPNEGSFGSLMPEPSLHTWRMTNEIVAMLLEGKLTWSQIKSNYLGQEPDQKEIELFCQLSPVQKRWPRTKNEIIDRWGVRRNIDGPFWPLGLGPLGPSPNLRDGNKILENDKCRQVRDKVPSKLEHFFVKRPSADGEINVPLKRPIVVFDSELSPPMEVRMRNAALLKDEGELIFESRFESGNLRQARRIGTFEYELILTPDLVTESHVQWFFFQVAGARSGVEYTLRIVNLLKARRLIKSDIPDNQKYAAVITARVHPGETVGSWNMKGLMEFLVNPENEKARELRRRYVFKLVPMLNADGVIVGNYRCSLVGRDVNRTYNIFGPDKIPEVHFTRKLVQYCQEICKDVVFCDFHGHSQAHNAFIYGTDSGYRSIPIENTTVQPKTYLTNPEQYLIDRMIPFLISKQDPGRFSFQSCRFSLQPWREGCARISLWRRFNLTHCFTMETSLFGTNLEPSSTFRYFDRNDLQNLGQSVSLALLDFHKIMSDKTKFSDTLVKMGKSLLHEIILSRILSKRQMTVAHTKLANASQSINNDLEKQISSVADFVGAFKEVGCLLEEGDEEESSSASDMSSLADLNLGHEDDMDILNLSEKPVVKRKRNRHRRHRKHRKCRRRRKNKRRRLAVLNNTSNNVTKGQAKEKLKEPMGIIQKSASFVRLAPPERHHLRHMRFLAGRLSSKIIVVECLPVNIEVCLSAIAYRTILEGLAELADNFQKFYVQSFVHAMETSTPSPLPHENLTFSQKSCRK